MISKENSRKTKAAKPGLGGKQPIIPRILERAFMVTLAIFLVFGLFPFLVFATDPADPAEQVPAQSFTEDSSTEAPDQPQAPTGNGEGLAPEGSGTEESVQPGAGNNEDPGVGGSQNAIVATGEINVLAGPWTVTYVFPDLIQSYESVLDGGYAPSKTVDLLSYQKVSFRGWFTVSNPVAGTSPYDFATPVTGDFTLYAVCADTYLISFLDQDGIVVESRELAPNARIYNPLPGTVDKIIPQGNGHKLEGFFDRDDPNPTNPPALINFDTATATKDLYLKPYFRQGYYVLFVSEGTQVDPQFVLQGGYATQPASPTRAGYEFKGWLKNGVDFSFSTQITEDTTLTAKFDPVEVDYTVALWMEKPNLFLPGAHPSTNTLSDYNYIGSVTLKGISESMTNVNANSPGIAEWWVNDTPITANSKAMLRYAQFQSAENKVIDGNGTTVVNLYAERKVYTYNFELNKDGTSMTVDGVRYDSGGTQYTMQVKFEMDVSTTFPVQANNNTPHLLFNGGTASLNFSSWNFSFGELGAGRQLSSRWITVNGTILPPNGAPTSGPTLTFTANWENPPGRSYNYRYLAEALEGQSYTSANSIYDPDTGKTYVVMSEYSETMTSTAAKGILIQKVINGLQRLGHSGEFVGWFDPTHYDNSGHPELYSGNYYDFWPYNYDGSAFTRMQRPPDGELFNVATTSTQLCFFYDRDLCNLEFNLMVGNGETPVSNANKFATQSLMFQQPFTIATKTFKPEDPLRPGYLFLGWFKDAEYMVPFDWSANATMPQGGTIAYAKWQAHDHTVSYFEAKGGVYLSDQGVKDGGYAVNPNHYVPGTFYAGKGEFIGWAYEIVAGVSAPFFFTTPIYKDFDVYATWHTDALKVEYNLAGGLVNGLNTPPVDNNEYAFGTSLRVLPTTATKGTQVFYAWKCGTKIYYPGAIVAISSLEELSFTAQYADLADLITVTYHMNGLGAGEDTTQTVYVNKLDTSFVLEGSLFTSSNPAYTLIGWRDDDLSKTDPQYQLNQTYTIASGDKLSGQKHFYGVWSSAKGTISGSVFDDLNGNGLFDGQNEALAGQTVTLYKETGP
ncbi:MAG: InlB B-repeat-containing protein, partial [Coriobacteriales bacterium]|nr:InlB B-repeat-containing protein [Coriobacteriales bacterium]